MARPSVGSRVPREIEEAAAIDEGGAPVPLGSLWAKGPCVLLLLRHFGCVGCAEEVTELAPRLEELRRAGIRTVLVGNGSPDQRAGFIERHALARAAVEILVDPSLAVYRALGLVRSAWATIGPRALYDMVRAMGRGHPHRSVEGDATQQGGALIVDREHIVRLYHRNRSLGDYAPASDLVQVALELSVETTAARV